MPFHYSLTGIQAQPPPTQPSQQQHQAQIPNEQFNIPANVQQQLQQRAVYKPEQQEEIIMAIVVEAGRVECIYQPVTNLKYQSFEMDYQVGLNNMEKIFL